MVNSKKKGNAWENEIAKMLRIKFIPPVVDPKIAHNLIHRTPLSGGHTERGDIIIKPPIWKQFPWFLECRNRESWSWKNLWEKGMNSVLGKWFLEDAEEICHPYDNNAKYPRVPMLLFTRKFEDIYFMVIADHLTNEIRNNQQNFKYALPSGDGAEDLFPRCMLLYFDEEEFIVAPFQDLLNLYTVDFDEVQKDIDQYLGETNG